MTETLELSKRLERCAEFLESYDKGLTFFVSTTELMQWAADIRSITIPERKQ